MTNSDSTKNTVLKLVETAMLSALAVVFMFFIRFPLLPGAKFLEYDMGDLPVLLATLLLGPGAGTAALLFVSAIQAFTVSAASGWQGLLMHFISSEAFLLMVYFLSKNNLKPKRLILAFSLGTVTMVALMIPLNLIFTPLYLHTSVQAVAELILPAILPFNLIKGVLNSLLCFGVYIPLNRILSKSHLLPQTSKK